MSVNAKKTNLIVFKNKNSNLNNSTITIVLDGNVLNCVVSIKFLEIYVDDRLCWRQHIRAVSVKISRNICILSKIRYKLPSYVLRNLYFTLIEPHLLFEIWYGDLHQRQILKAE